LIRGTPGIVVDAYGLLVCFLRWFWVSFLAFFIRKDSEWSLDVSFAEALMPFIEFVSVQLIFTITIRRVGQGLCPSLSRRFVWVTLACGKPIDVNIPFHIGFGD
jgi:hypothetical protein